MITEEEFLRLKERFDALKSAYDSLIVEKEKLERIITRFEELTYSLEETGFADEN